MFKWFRFIAPHPVLPPPPPPPPPLTNEQIAAKNYQDALASWKKRMSDDAAKVRKPYDPTRRTKMSKHPLDEMLEKSRQDALDRAEKFLRGRERADQIVSSERHRRVQAGWLVDVADFVIAEAGTLLARDHGKAEGGLAASLNLGPGVVHEWDRLKRAEADAPHVTIRRDEATNRLVSSCGGDGERIVEILAILQHYFGAKAMGSGIASRIENEIVKPAVLAARQDAEVDAAAESATDAHWRDRIVKAHSVIIDGKTVKFNGLFMPIGKEPSEPPRSASRVTKSTILAAIEKHVFGFEWKDGMAVVKGKDAAADAILFAIYGDERP